MTPVTDFDAMFAFMSTLKSGDHISLFQFKEPEPDVAVSTTREEGARIEFETFARIDFVVRPLVKACPSNCTKDDHGCCVHIEESGVLRFWKYGFGLPATPHRAVLRADRVSMNHPDTAYVPYSSKVNFVKIIIDKGSWFDDAGNYRSTGGPTRMIGYNRSYFNKWYSRFSTDAMSTMYITSTSAIQASLMIEIQRRALRRVLRRVFGGDRMTADAVAREWL
jgi:hypothetical protein